MATDPGIGNTAVYVCTDPHYTFFEDLDAGITTTHYSPSPVAGAIVSPAQTGPVTGLYDPEWTAMMAIE